MSPPPLNPPLRNSICIKRTFSFVVFWDETVNENQNLSTLDIYIYNDPTRKSYVPLVVNTSRSFHHSRLVNGFVTRFTRRVSLMKQELNTLPEHLGSPPVFSGVRVMRFLVLCVCFVDHCLSFCNFFFLPLC